MENVKNPRWFPFLRGRGVNFSCQGGPQPKNVTEKVNGKYLNYERGTGEIFTNDVL